MRSAHPGRGTSRVLPFRRAGIAAAPGGAGDDARPLSRGSRRARMVPEQLPQGRRRVATVTGPSGKTVRYCLIDDVETLLWAVNLGTIEFHPFLARASDPDRPLVLALDLDPGPPAGLAECCAVALALRDLLAPLQSLVKTSGAKGLHVYVPLNGTATFAQTKAFARELAGRLPELATERHSRSARAGKVLIDWGQNDPNRSIVAPWSLRATRVPLVSTPLEWDELRAPQKLAFTPAAALERMARTGDFFRPVLDLVQMLPGD